MRTMIILSIAAAATATPALAQEVGQSVNDYLCQFANKCDTPAASAQTPAPATGPAPQTRTSATRGFRVAGGTVPTVTPAPVTTTRTTRVVRPTAAPVRPGRRVDLRLAFDYNSDQMTPGAQAQAKVFAQALMMPELRSRRFRIEGHTDSRGSRVANVDLSRRRAQSVADFLVAQGVDRANIEVRGLGSQQPLPGQPATAEANRRVEAVLIS